MPKIMLTVSKNSGDSRYIGCLLLLKCTPPLQVGYRSRHRSNSLAQPKCGLVWLLMSGQEALPPLSLPLMTVPMSHVGRAIDTSRAKTDPHPPAVLAQTAKRRCCVHAFFARCACIIRTLWAFVGMKRQNLLFTVKLAIESNVVRSQTSLRGTRF